MSTAPPSSAGFSAAAENTALSWRRTALGLGAGAVAAAHGLSSSIGPAAWNLALAGVVLAGLIARSAGRRLSGVHGLHPSLVDEAATRTVGEDPGGHLVTASAALLFLIGLAAVVIVLR